MTFACSRNGRGDSSSSSRSPSACSPIWSWGGAARGTIHRTTPSSRGGSTRPERPTVPAARSGVRPAGPPLIVATGLSTRYGTAIALDCVDLQITRGSTYGLIGPNGAGKDDNHLGARGSATPDGRHGHPGGRPTEDRGAGRHAPVRAVADGSRGRRPYPAPHGAHIPRTRVEQALAEVDLREARGPVGGYFPGHAPAPGTRGLSGRRARAADPRRAVLRSRPRGPA